MNKLFTILVTLVITCTLFAGTYSGGDGTASSPYQIATLADLEELSTSRVDWFYDLFFKQTANIDASSTSSWNSGAGFTPIGLIYDASFMGTYDGDGHTISSLMINQEWTDKIALFGYTKNATIKNLGVINVNITGGSSVGAIGGYISNTIISNCYSNGTLSGRYCVGGLLGTIYNACNISNSYSSANVSGDEIIGGFMGNLWSGVGTSVNNCYSSGTVGSLSSGGGGGFIGVDITPSASTVTNCFWDVETSGQDTSYGGTGKTTLEMKNITTFTDTDMDGLETAWDFSGTLNDDSANNDYWDMDSTETINSGYPFLSSGLLGGYFTSILEIDIPLQFVLGNNYPNPFNPSTTISFQLSAMSDVKLTIYEMNGKMVSTLINDNMPAGYHDTSWDASDFSSGIYFYRLQAGDFVDTKKMVFMK